MYENNFSREIDNNEYYVPQNFRPTYEDPYSARFVNAMPSNYYEDTVVQNFDRRVMQPYNYNNENYNSFGTINYDNIHSFDANNFMEENNIQYYENDIELEEDFMEMYPEVYKKVMPIIDRIVNERKIKKVNNGVIDLLTLEIYDEFENNESKKVNSESVTDKNSNVVTNNNATKNTNISVSNTNTILRNSNNNIISKTNNNIISKSNNSSKNEGNKIASATNINSNINVSTNVDNKNEKTVEVATRYRNTKNPTLRDLIRILLLNKLFGNGNNRPRPPRPRPYQNYNPRMIPTNYNLNARYDNYNVIPETNYMRSYFNSPYPEENQ